MTALATALIVILALWGHQGMAQDDLDGLRKNIPGEPGKDYPIFSTNILCKINPRNPGCGRGGGAGGGARNQGNKPAASQGSNGNNRNGGGPSRSNKGNARGNGGRPKASNGAPSNSRSTPRANGGSTANGDALDSLRKNIPGEPGKDYPINSPDILCKINPQNPGCGRGGGGGSQSGNQGNRPNSQGSNGNSGGAADRSNKASADFRAQIAKGQIPGVAGKDYPVNSLRALQQRPGLGGLQPAPDHLITPDYPGLGSNGGGGGGRKGRPSGAGGRKTGSSQSYCAGGSLQACIGFCPSDESGSEFSACVTNCGENCESK